MTRPTNPRKGQYVWHLGWEIFFSDDAEFWTGNGWQAYKGGADIGAPNLSACTFEDLIAEIEAAEESKQMTEIEQEVSEAMAANPHYPLGEPDAMKWAVAWRLTRDRNGINANASNAPGEDIDGWMVGWFANCMASARPEMLMQRSIEEPKS